MTSRNELFNACKAAALENIKKDLKLSTLVSCLPAAVQKDKDFCQSLHKTLLDKVTSGICDSTDELSEKVALKHKLDLLDKIEADPNNHKQGEGVAWRPSSSHLDNQAPRDRSSIQAARDQLESEVLSGLNAALKKAEAEVTALSNEVDEAADSIGRIVAAIADATEDQDQDSLQQSAQPPTGSDTLEKSNTPDENAQ